MLRVEDGQVLVHHRLQLRGTGAQPSGQVCQLPSVQVVRGGQAREPAVGGMCISRRVWVSFVRGGSRAGAAGGGW